MRRWARVTAILLTSLATTSTVVACTDEPAGPGPGPTSAPTVEAAGLTFGPCDEGAVPEQDGVEATCGILRVPLDHGDPAGDTLGIAVARVLASEPQERVGSLVLNPGGPGRSGLAFLPGWVAAMPDEVLRRFDVVSFDPRGVGASERIACEPLPQDETARAVADVRTDAGYALARRNSRDLTRACRSTLGVSAASFDTAATAEDLDLLRDALGDDSLTYVGFSYGARLGSAYAHQFPDRVRALVLDAPSDPQATVPRTVLRQVRAFDEAFEEYAEGCATRPSCAPIAASGGPRRYVRRLVRQADAAPIPSGRPQGDRDANGADVLDAVLLLQYAEVYRSFLDDVLVEAARGDSGSLWDAIDSFLGADGDDANGRPDDIDPQFVINCNDLTERPGRSAVRSVGERLARQSSMFGVYAGEWLMGCDAWPVGPGLAVPTTTTAAPLLVVGSTGDPATPYAGAVTLAGLLGERATLLTRDGAGHTSFLTGNACVDDAVTAYLLTLTLPESGTRC